MPARPHCETGHSSVNKSNPFFFIAGIELVDGRFQFNKGEASDCSSHTNMFILAPKKNGGDVESVLSMLC